MTVSVAYSAVGFFIGWLIWKRGSIGTVEVLPNELDWWLRVAFIVFLTAIIVFHVWYFQRWRGIGEDTLRKYRRQARADPSASITKYAVWASAATLMGIYIVASFPAVVGQEIESWSNSWVIALGLGVAVSLVAAGILFMAGSRNDSIYLQETAVGAAIGAWLAATLLPIAFVFVLLLVVASMFLGIQTSITILEGFSLVFLVFMFIVPIVNAGVDLLSWALSRWLGTVIVHHKSVWRIAGFATVDAVAAVVFLAVVTIALTAAVQGLNILMTAHGLAPVIDLHEFLASAVGDSWNSNEIWVTIMLLSTLVPTAIHLFMLILCLLTIVPPRRYCLELAERLEVGDPVYRDRSNVAWYFALLWPAAAISLIMLSWAGLYVIGETIEPVSEMLYDLAIWTIDIVDSFHVNVGADGL